MLQACEYEIPLVLELGFSITLQLLAMQKLYWRNPIEATQEDAVETPGWTT